MKVIFVSIFSDFKKEEMKKKLLLFLMVFVALFTITACDSIKEEKADVEIVSIERIDLSSYILDKNKGILK